MTIWRRIGLVLVSLTLFVTGLKLMQVGVRVFGPLLERNVELDSPVSAFAFGWTAACALLSGSPVAAMAVTFLDAGQIREASAFAMVTGSRFGASCVILLLALVYVAGHRQSVKQLRIAILVLIVTATIYMPAFVLGYATLETGITSTLGAGGSPLGGALEGTPMDQAAQAAESALPAWAVFLAGLIVIIGSFKLFDFSLPKSEEAEEALQRMRYRIYGRWPMFALGAVITLFSMSVSISLGLLIPLQEKSIVRAKYVVPYILGANIATFTDTLLAAAAMKRNAAMVIVTVEMVSVAVVSILVLLLAYERYEKAMLAAVDAVTANKRNVSLLVAFVTLLPLSLLALAIFGGP